MHQLTEKDWRQAQRIKRGSANPSSTCSIWSTDHTGTFEPIAVPTIFLSDRPGYGSYFVSLATREVSRNVDSDSAVQVTLSDSRTPTWLRSLGFQRFQSSAGVRLVGTAGNRRRATADEQHYAQSVADHYLPAELKWFGAGMYVRELRFRSLGFERVDAHPEAPISVVELEAAF